MKDKGTIKVNGTEVDYELRKNGSYSRSLYMRYGARNFKHMGSVHPYIKYNAVLQYARQYLRNNP